MNVFKNKKQLVALLLIISAACILRFYSISTNPPGLYIDEVSIGNNAYSILTKGVDEHDIPYPIWFRAFGEYKMPVYIYGTSVSMALFGKNEFSVRFLSAVAGSLTVIFFYFFSVKLLALQKNVFSKDTLTFLPIVATLLLAISPWHIQFSRGGFEVTVAVFLYLLGGYFFLFFLEQKKIWYLYLSIVIMILTIYTYQSFRVVAPITMFVAIFYSYRNKLLTFGELFVTITIAGILMLPILAFSVTQEGSERFIQTSAFAHLQGKNSVDTSILVFFTYLKNYLSFFSLHFLFNFGDGIGRHQLPAFGVLWRWQLPFLLIGIITLLKEKKKPLFSRILFFVLILGPIPAALVIPSPHTLRTLLMVLPFTFLITVGVIRVLSMLRKSRKLFLPLILIPILVFELVFYLHHYYVHYPKVNVLDWGGAKKEMVRTAEKYRQKYPIIAVDSAIPFAYDYFRFYDDTLPVHIVYPNWQIPQNWDKDDILVIRPYYGEKTGVNIIDAVYLPNANKDIYVQFRTLHYE